MTSNLPINLLAEESTIDPRSPLPSFLEMKLVHATAQSGRTAINSSIDAIIAKLNYAERGYPPSSFRSKLAILLSRICQRYKNEVQMVVNYFIERQCLRSNSSATLSESLYGLTRSRISRNGEISVMKESDEIRAALLLAMGPYLKSRLDKCYENERDREDEQVGENQSLNQKRTALEKLRSTFYYIYPFLHMSHDGIQLAYQFAYLIGRSVYFDPALHALGLVVRRITMKDMDDGKKSQDMNPKKPSLDEFVSKQTVAYLKKAAAVGVASALLVGWLGKFHLEMRRTRRRWIVNNENESANTSNGRARGREEAVVVVPPPPLPSPLGIEGRVQPSRDKPLCPICLQKRVNPAASSSGYVFCYKCLVVHIREEGEKCPVTGGLCEMSQIVRLYESSEHLDSSKRDT